MLCKDGVDRDHRLLAGAQSLAHTQGAVLFELRAASGLARTYVTVGDATHAREIPQPVLDTYLQHRDGLDYQDAVRVLNTPSADAVP